jgi:GxxExxY protein
MPVSLDLARSFDPSRYKHQETTKTVLRCFYEVYNELGLGSWNQSTKRRWHERSWRRALGVKRQFPLPVFFRGQQIGDFRANLLVNDVVIVELKAARILEPVHEAQLLNYLRANRFEIGLLLNFGPIPRARRLILTNDKKRNLCSSVLTSG